MNKKIRQRLEAINTARKGQKIAAWIGDLFTGDVKVDSTVNSRIYVTVHKTGQVLKVRNQKAPNRLKWPVWVGYVPGSRVLNVIGTRDVFPNTSIPEIPDHSHTIYESDNPTWVRKQQILDEGLPVPIGGMQIKVVGHWYYANGQFHIINVKTYDLTSYIPTTGARWVNVEIDEDGTATYNVGTSVSSRIVLSPENIPATAAAKRLEFSVKTYASQTHIINTRLDTDLFDPRFTGKSTGGGIAGSVDWANITNKPTEFNPDLSVTDPLYSRRWLKNADPTINDDLYAGYEKLHFWLNQGTSEWFVCLDDTIGAAVWQSVGSGGSGDMFFFADGPLAIADPCDVPQLITKDTTISAVYLFCENTGISGSTIVDIKLDDGVYQTSIFDSICDLRPALPFNDANKWVKAIPEIIDFVEGDILIPSIDAVASGASGMRLIIQVSSSAGGGGSFNLTVGGISNVTEIQTEGLVVEDLLGGVVSIKPVDYILIEDQKSAGTDGGTFTSGAWQTRVLNTEVNDAGGHASIASNQITLAAGTYRFRISCPAFKVNNHQAKLHNVTDTVDIKMGTSMYSGSSDFSGNRSEIIGEFTIAASKVLEIRHRCGATEATNGFGEKANFGSTEVYTVAELWKVA